MSSNAKGDRLMHPPAQLLARSQLGQSWVWTSELPHSAAWAAEYWDGEAEIWRTIPPAWKDKRNWVGLRFRGQDG